MGKIIHINMGIDSMAKSFLALNAEGVGFETDTGKKFFPVEREFQSVGRLKNIQLKRYPLKNGTFAEEFVQTIVRNEEGSKLYFLGLNANDRNFLWPASKIMSKSKSKKSSKK